jgi:hypothetical protein
VRNAFSSTVMVELRIGITFLPLVGFLGCEANG